MWKRFLAFDRLRLIPTCAILLLLGSVAGGQLNVSQPSPVSVSQYGGTATTLGQKASASSVPVVLPSDQATAGAPLFIRHSDGTRGMECTSRANINQTASAQLITGTASQKIYFCTVMVISGTAQNIELVEGTGTTCGTGTAGLWGGTTAATGPNLAANGGFAVASPAYTNFTATAADNVCLLQSGTGQVSGWITYVSQ